MKTYRICAAVLSLAILPPLCFAQCARPAKATKHPSKPQGAATTAKSVDQRVVDLEKEGWEAIKKKDWNGLGALMTSDFVMVDENGIVSGRAEVLKMLADLNVTDYFMEDAKVVMLDKDAALLTYKVTQKGSVKGQPIPSKPYYASSVYVKHGNKWLNVLYQQSLSQ